MTYQAAGSEKVSGYLNAIDAKCSSLDKNDALKFLKFSCDSAQSRITPDLTGESKAELEYVVKQISERYFRLAG